MYFKFNGLVFGDGQSNYDVESPVQGLGVPTIRNDIGDYAGQNGAYISSQFFSYRTIILTILYHGNTCEEADDARYNFGVACRIGSSSPLHIVTPSGKRYVSYVNVTDVKMDSTDPLYGEIQLTLSALDPYLYDEGAGVIAIEVNKIVGGGYDVPMTFPYIYSPGTTPAEINNNGDIVVHPVIDIIGNFTNPKVTNIQTGDYIQVNTTTAPTDHIEIDCQNRTVTLNGGSILPEKSGTWLSIPIGNNIFKFDSGSNDDTGTCTITYQIGVASI